MTPSMQVADALNTAAAEAARRAALALVGMQTPGGFWCGKLTADTTLESDFILLELWLHPPENGVWTPPDRARIDRAVKFILERQLPDGGFWVYPNGPADVSATVKAYFALKLAGIRADDPRMVRARETIVSLGGIQAANSYVKINLSLFGLYPRRHVPSIPPEIMLLPGGFIYRMSSWTRAIVIPLSVVHAFDPCRPVPAGFDLSELFAPGVSTAFAPADSLFSWRKLFYTLDRIVKWWERFGPRAIRRRAIQRARDWMLARTHGSDGLGAIYPPMMYLIMALDLLGYPPGHPDRVEARRQFERLIVDDGERLHFQPCFSPVWDTGIAMYALGESGLAPEAPMRRAADWILSKEVRSKGDWSVKRPRLEPAGWYFEFANEFYPDIDDTAQVLLGLRNWRAGHPAAQKASEERAVRWLLGMQSADGGWAAFDADNNWEFLSNVPFADHNAMLDPTCPDITGRVLEALCAYGLERDHPAIRRGVEYLVCAQNDDGSWYGRWGVDYIYGTFLALRGLQAAGESDREAHVLCAGEWLRSVQNADGGWGESCASYDNNSFTSAPSAASQTAWAILGLIASGDTASSSVGNGVEFLLGRQREDGTWEEDPATGTGFPRVFYLTYRLYRNSFPLLALSVFLGARAAHRGENP